MSTWQLRVEQNPEVLQGKPCIRGTRLSIELIVGWLAQGWTHEMLLESYPQLTQEDILAALAFTADMLREETYLSLSRAAA